MQLNAKSTLLGAALLRNHDTRNKMQHVNAAFTVDDQHCADAIGDAVNAIEHCFPGSAADYPEALNVALRVVRIHSSKGNVRLRVRFEDEMRAHRWNGEERRSRVSEPPIPVGSRRYWGLVLLPEYAQIEIILNRISAP